MCMKEVYRLFSRKRIKDNRMKITLEIADDSNEEEVIKIIKKTIQKLNCLFKKNLSYEVEMIKVHENHE